MNRKKTLHYRNYETNWLESTEMGFVVTIDGVLIGQLKGVDTQLYNGDNVILMSLMSGR